MGWLGCTGMVFQRTRQVGVVWDEKLCGWQIEEGGVT